MKKIQLKTQHKRDYLCPYTSKYCYNETISRVKIDIEF